MKSTQQDTKMCEKKILIGGSMHISILRDTLTVWCILHSVELLDNVPCDLLRCWQPPALQHLQCPWLSLFQVIHYEKVILLLPSKRKQTQQITNHSHSKHLLFKWLNKLEQLLTCLYSSSVMVPSLSVSCILNRTIKKDN